MPTSRLREGPRRRRKVVVRGIAASDAHRFTPLFYACVNDVVKLLCERCPEQLLAKDLLGNTCLHSASQRGHVDVVRILCEVGGPDLRQELLLATDSIGRTCLHSACEKGHLDVVQQLLCEEGPRELLLAKDGNGDTCLDLAIAQDHV